jgi:MFS family permease
MASTSATPVSSPLTHREVSSSMRLSILAGCFGMLWMSLSVGLPLTMFLEAIGASGVMIGLITTVRLFSMSAQIPGAVLAEAFGSRKRVWAVMALLHRALWFVPAGLALFCQPEDAWVPVVVALVVTLSDILGHGATAPWLSWMTDLVPKGSSGRFWGTRQSIVTAVSLLGLWSAGFLLDLYPNRDHGLFGFAVVFGLAGVFGIADILLHLGVREPGAAVPQLAVSRLHRLLAPVKNIEFRRLTLSLGIWNFGFFMVATFGIVYLRKAFGLSYAELASLTVAGAVGSVISSHFIGKLIDRLGARISCALLFLSAPLTLSPYFFLNREIIPVGGIELSQVTILIFLASLAGGALFSGVGLCQIRLVGLLSPPEGRTLWLAVHFSLVGILSAMGPLAGGAVMDWFDSRTQGKSLFEGMEFSFYHVQILLFALVAWAMALPLLLRVRTPVREIAFNLAFSEIFLTSPVQVLRNFYNISLLNSGSTRYERLRAARKLGGNRSLLAIPDLIAKLDDPSLDMREEAIEALGEIASPEALQPLIERLGEPGNWLAPQICRALRKARRPEAVDVLLAQLQGGDREVQLESVRALGAIGDRRAIPGIIELIRDTRDHKLLTVCGDALAALGELSVAWQIIPQLRETTNPTLKQALSLALGDLLGEKERFYELLICEREAAGSGAAKVLAKLLRRVRKSFPRAGKQIETIAEIEESYMGGDWSQSSALLLHLGLHLVQFKHRLQLTLDPDQAMQTLMEKDRQAAIVVWYLKILGEPWKVGEADLRNGTDLLLGFHILCSLLGTEQKEQSGDNPV